MKRIMALGAAVALVLSLCIPAIQAKEPQSSDKQIVAGEPPHGGGRRGGGGPPGPPPGPRPGGGGHGPGPGPRPGPGPGHRPGPGPGPWPRYWGGGPGWGGWGGWGFGIGFYDSPSYTVVESAPVVVQQQTAPYYMTQDGVTYYVVNGYAYPVQSTGTVYTTPSTSGEVIYINP